MDDNDFEAWLRDCNRTGWERDSVVGLLSDEAFDRWLKQVKADAWEEGALAASHEGTVDWSQHNPYRQQEKFLKDLRD